MSASSGIVRALRSEFDWFRRDKKEVALVLSVFLLGFLFYLLNFLRNQLVPMIDGPYYLTQVRSLLTTGNLVYGDPPLTFIILAPFSILLGDVSLGVKVGIAFFSALSVVPAYFLMNRVGKGILAGTLVMLFLVFSSLYIRTLSDFMKNAIGICWLLAFIYYLHDLAFSGLNKKSLTLAAFFLVLTGLTHILDFGIAILFIVFYTLVALVFDINRRQFLKASGILLLAVGVFVIVTSVFFGSLFTDFSKALYFIGEIVGFGGSEASTTVVTQIPIGAIRPKPQIDNMSVFSLSLVGGWGAVAFILGVGAVSSFFAWKKKEKGALLLLPVATVIGAIVSFPLLPGELLGRFLLMMVIPTIIVLSYALSKVWSFGVGDMKFVALLLIAISLFLFVGQSVRTLQAINPSISNAGYQDLVDMKNMIDSDSVIVADKGQGLGYWAEYVEEIEILGVQELSADLWQSYSRVFGIFPNAQVPSMPHQNVFVGSVYVLVEITQVPNQ